MGVELGCFVERSPVAESIAPAREPAALADGAESTLEFRSSDGKELLGIEALFGIESVLKKSDSEQRDSMSCR